MVQVRMWELGAQQVIVSVGHPGESAQNRTISSSCEEGHGF